MIELLQHGREDGANDDAMALVRGFFRPECEAVEDGAHDLGQGEPGAEVLLGRESNLGVDDTVAGQVDRGLGGDTFELIARLHHRDGVRETFEVANEVTARRVDDEPASKFLGVRGR